MKYYGEYRIDPSFGQHSCYWNSAIVRDCENGNGMYWKDVALICECDADMAEMICAALNAWRSRQEDKK